MMIKNQLYRSALIIAACGFTAYASSARAAQLFVDDDFGQCPNAQYQSIQAAVTAAKPGDTVNVCSGTYHEQVTINKKLTVQGFETTNANQAIVMPTGVVANSTSLTSMNPIAAIILVDGADGVNLSDLTVDGASNGINGCAPNFIGVYYRNSSGTADSLAIRNIKLGSGLEGCQSGLGIFAQSGAGGKSKVTLSNNSVHDYQKNGITANEAGTNASIKGNDVAGAGLNPNNGQNGIQVADGAVGMVDTNFVLNNLYGQCSDTNSCGAAATNILVVDSNGVKVTNNTVGNSQINYYQGNKGEVTGNTIFQSHVFDGIDLVGDSNKANNNSIFNSDESAVYILGNNNDANGNTINETPAGVFIDSPSSGTHVMGNKFYNTAAETTTASPGPVVNAATLNASTSASRPSPVRP
jgi:hypothetical protein